MVLVHCTSCHCPLPVYNVSSIQQHEYCSYAPDKIKIQKITKGNNSFQRASRVMVLVHCTSPYQDESTYEVSSTQLHQYWSYAPDKIKRLKITKGNNSFQNTCRVMVLVHCTSSHQGLSTYEVSSTQVQQFWRNAPDKYLQTNRRTDRRTAGQIGRPTG